MKYTSIALTFLPFLATAKLGESGQGNRHLQAEIPIVKMGEEPATPLGRCEGDCDKDSDCGSGLKCYQRTENFKAVPGCSGGAQDSSFFDYCVRNSDNFPVLSKVGANPGVPLERCEGDCDSDSECASSDLFCFPRNDDVVVPGCRGGQSDDSKFDYCIRRVDAPPGVAPTVPTADPSPDPTPDPSPDPTPDPSPSPVNSPTPDPTPGPTPDPTPGPTPASAPSGGDPPVKATYDFPLGLCEGDCDDDPDCEDGLICFQRDANESVPGCSGGSSDRSRTDYCIKENPSTPPPTPPPAPAPTPTSPGKLHLKITQSFPLGRCEGDCDRDVDCQSGLKCFQRDGGESVPGCSGGSSDHSRTDYCIPKYNSPTPAPAPTPTSYRPPLRITQSFPLGLCEGDCDRDVDCQSGLKCFQRDAGDSVPGCSGGSSDHSRTDYCIPK
uniref:Alpha 2 frustulin n=1 Tax=Cylindrotheca fusiformis TaxID=2853 RepID=Q39495_CYLFU|nr:alpha 2 frustulin [Cylindrotheca fusiformis]